MEIYTESLTSIDILEAAIIESYITQDKEKYFQDEPLNHAQSQKEKEERWAREFYHRYLRNILIRQSFRCKQLQHRFQASFFLPLIPPQTITSETLRCEAFRIISLICPAVLLNINSALWDKWVQIEEMQDTITQEPETLFELFIEE